MAYLQMRRPNDAERTLELFFAERSPCSRLEWFLGLVATQDDLGVGKAPFSESC
jgi:hypothetical protein